MTRFSRALAVGVAAVALCITGPGSSGPLSDLASSAQAKEQGHGQGGGNQGHGGPKKSHPHHHMNAHNLLGEKLHQDGKHEVGKIGDRSVTAEVKNGKVTNMSAGDLPLTKVKSKSKMASAESGFIPAAYTGAEQLAQYDTSGGYYYYGYCTDDGYDTTCYWYEASDVDTSGYWADYDSYDASY